MSAAPTPPTASPPRTLVVACADWPVIAAGFSAHHPHPVLVVHANRVVAANVVARAAGVAVGDRRREAQRACPDAHLLDHDPTRAARRFERVAAQLATLTPKVEVVQAGVGALATRGPSRYFGGDQALAERVVALVEAVEDAEVHVGVADGPVVAHLAARRSPAGRPLIVAPGSAAAFLGPIALADIADLVPDPEVLGTWHQLGLRTLADVAALPAGSVLGRFGPAGRWVHRLARGEDPHPLTALDPPPDLTVDVALDPPAWRSDLVAFAARAAADDLIAQLDARGVQVTQVTVALHSEHEEALERSWRLDGPARAETASRSSAAAIGDRVRWQVEGWLSGPLRTRPTAGIARLVLIPDRVEPARGRQLGFWGQTRGASESVVRAVARLEALAGAEAVRVPEVRGGRQPGEEVALIPTAAIDLAVPREVGAPRAPWPGRLTTPSPTLLVEPPQPAEVLDARGCSVEVDGRGEILGAPATVRWGPPGSGASGMDHAVAAWAGPWPSDERWWERAERRRQARIQVVTDRGVALVLSRRSQRWWLTAVYA